MSERYAELLRNVRDAYRQAGTLRLPRWVREGASSYTVSREKVASMWRVGRKLGRTLYKDDVCVGMVDTPELAAAIVARMNETAKPPRGLACKTCLGARVMCYREMRAVPCEAPHERQCPNTGHHPCTECY